jgi:hypothetical protein
VVQRPKIYQKKLPKKIFQDGGYFQNGICTFFLYENMSCDRYFSSIELIFGLSQYFFMFSYIKKDFRFSDHPNMGLPYIMTNPCNFGSESASGLVFVFIGYFTLLIDKKIIIKVFGAPEHGIGVCLAAYRP